MNPQIQTVINLINQIFTANGNQEITGTNSNSVLRAIVNALYQITGDPQYLNTEAKDNLVDAINELDDLIGQINTIKLFSGESNPNNINVNGGDYEVRDFYMQTQSGVGTIALWIYTGVIGVGWLNLTAKDIEWVAVLPTTGVDNKLYVRGLDDTFWRYRTIGTVEKPTGWYQLGGGSGEEIHTHSFTFDGSNAIQTTAFPINGVIDFQIEGGCMNDQYVVFTDGQSQFDTTTAIDVVMFAPARCKLIYKTNN